MLFRSLTDRILFFFAALLLVVQLGAFWVVLETNRSISIEHLNHEADTIERVLTAYLSMRRASLADSVAEYAGRPDHLNRSPDTTKLDFVDRYPTSDEVLNRWLIQSLVNRKPVDRIEGIVDRDGRLYQVVALASSLASQDPASAAFAGSDSAVVSNWVIGGFALDDAYVAELESLVNVEVFFASRHDLEADGVSDIRIDDIVGSPRASHSMDLSQAPKLLLPLDISGEYSAVVRLPLSTGPSVYHQQRATLMLLAAFSLFVSLLAGYAIAHEITKPLKKLNRIAQKIREGDYSSGIAVRQRDEIGQLAESVHFMSESVAEREAKILQLAYADTLTGLPNRAMFNDRLRQAVSVSQRSTRSFTVLMIDLDRFKYINDVLGHESGDLVLQEVAKRLDTVLRESDTVARLGGDEFAVLLQTGNSDRVMTAIRKMMAVLADPVMLNNQPVDIGCSIGIACFPEHGEEASLLMRRADIAMYSAKRLNSDFAFYNPDCEEHQQEHLSLLGEIKQAVEQDQLQLFFQPKMCLENESAISVETLLRWQHPKQGLVPPEEFIPFAEQTGAIRLITAWVIRNAVAQCGRWHKEGLSIKMSLNISARDLLDPKLPELTQQALDEHQVPASAICYEITESALMEDPVKAHQTVTRLYEMGIEISIDDYGTGYSSLAYVKKLPIHELKIDREFVKNMIDNHQDTAIVQSTIELGHNLGLKVVAEGIESEEELAMLKRFGCDQVQGFLISRAMAAGDFESWIEKYLADLAKGRGGEQADESASTG